MNSLILIPLVLAAAQQGAQATDSIRIKAAGQDGFEITYTAYGTTDPFEAQRRLMPEAARLCSPAQAMLGKYRFTGREPVTGSPDPGDLSVELVQRVQCGGDATAPVAAESPGPTDAVAAPLAPGADQDAHIVGLTERYLDARTEGHFAANFESMDASLLALIDKDEWQRKQGNLSRLAGATEARIVYRVTWYDDPPGASPGRYAAADFVTLSAGLAFHCGYIAWRQLADGRFLVVREEDSYLDAASAAGMSAADQALAKARVGCPDVTSSPQ